jgi:hypothetical protein
MRNLLAPVLLILLARSATLVQTGESADSLAKMRQIFRVAAADLSGKEYRVVFATEDNGESLNMRHWIVTVQAYPAGYKAYDDQVGGVIFSGPPCPPGMFPEFCSVRNISGDILFVGRFDVLVTTGRVGFVGNVGRTASKMLVFDKQLKAHQQWTPIDISAALASAGAKFGPDKEKEFRETLPDALKTLEQAFGPMRINKVSSMKPTFLRIPGKEPQLIGWPAYWSVSTILLRNRKERLVMYFEPFDGRLQSLYVSQGSTVLDPKTHKPKWKPPDD